MKIVIIAPGSRGDIQPYVALGRGLQDAGFGIRIMTHRTYESLAASHGLDIAPLEIDMAEVVEQEKMRKALEGGSLLISMVRMAGEMRRGAAALARHALQACAGADMIMTGIGGLFTALALAEKTGMPLLQAYNLPLTPTRAFPGALAPAFPPGFGRILNLPTHHVTRQVLWQAARPGDAVIRREVLGLAPAPLWGPFRSELLQGPILYGFSPAVIAPPPDWDGARIHVTGTWSVEPAGEWEPPESLTRFLEAGPPPVYVGFGSMASRKPQEAAGIVIDALGRIGRRGILFSGWSGLSPDHVPQTIHVVASIPHTWLFPRMAAVVHHGGAGTTMAGLRAGVPAVVVPFHADQPFWGRCVAAAGAGPRPIPRGKLTVERLAQALDQALSDRGMSTRAAALGEIIRAEDGVSRAVAVVKSLVPGGGA